MFYFCVLYSDENLKNVMSGEVSLAGWTGTSSGDSELTCVDDAFEALVAKTVTAGTGGWNAIMFFNKYSKY